MEVGRASSIIGHVDVCETVPERREEGRGAVGLAETEVQVRMTDIEVKARVGGPLEYRLKVSGTGELPVEVLDHQPDATAGGIFSEIHDRIGVHLSDVVHRMERDLLIGMHVDELDPGIGECVERLFVEIACGRSELGKGRRDRQVPRRMSDGGEPEVAHQPPDLFPIRGPRRRRLEGEIDEVETVLGDAVDLFGDATPREVHRTDLHGRSLEVSVGILAVMETYDAIMTRRSTAKTTDEVPPRADIEKLLDAAVRAPTHHLTQPWRFVVLTGDALDDLGAAWVAGQAKTGKDTTGLAQKTRRAPVIITVIDQPHLDHPKVIQEEEHYATGAAMQNILLAAHDMGLGAMLRTGPAATLQEVRDYLGVRDDEVIAGLIYVGYPAPGDAERPMTRREAATDRTEWRGWA